MRKGLYLKTLWYSFNATDYSCLIFLCRYFKTFPIIACLYENNVTALCKASTIPVTMSNIIVSSEKKKLKTLTCRPRPNKEPRSKLRPGSTIRPSRQAKTGIHAKILSWSEVRCIFLKPANPFNNYRKSPRPVGVFQANSVDPRIYSTSSTNMAPLWVWRIKITLTGWGGGGVGEGRENFGNRIEVFTCPTLLFSPSFFFVLFVFSRKGKDCFTG